MSYFGCNEVRELAPDLALGTISGGERAGVAPRPHERLLGDVLGRAGVAHHRERQPVDTPLEPGDEGRGGLGVPGGQTGQQRIVGYSPHDSPTDGVRHGIASAAAPDTVAPDPIHSATVCVVPITGCRADSPHAPTPEGASHPTLPPACGARLPSDAPARDRAPPQEPVRAAGGVSKPVRGRTSQVFGLPRNTFTRPWSRHHAWSWRYPTFSSNAAATPVPRSRHCR